MSAEAQALDRLAAFGTAAAQVREELAAIRARKLILCEKCGRRTVVSALTYLQTHFYIAPHGCTGGDYWKAGEGCFRCPKCGKRNRLYDRADVVALKPYFASVEDVYGR